MIKLFKIRGVLFIAMLLFALIYAANIDAEDKGKTPLVIATEGSFFVGGSLVKAPGVFDPTKPLPAPDDGQSFQIDQLYAQYQIPVDQFEFPIVFVHGASQTGKTWESTPDGREGFQSIFVRRGYGVYVVDFPRRGRAGFPSFNASLGSLKGSPVIQDFTTRFGNEEAFILFRLGRKYQEYFLNTAFPKEALDQFQSQIVPYVVDNADVITSDLAALLEKSGPAILVTHSQSGLFGWLTAIKSLNVKAIVSYEPISFVFPETKVPETIPMYSGVKYSAGLPVTFAAFKRLVEIPIQIVFGDNIPDEPTPIVALDFWRIESHAAEDFVAAVNAVGGHASILRLPKAGLSGNTHFPFSDQNNQAVADLMSQFLKKNGLEKREKRNEHTKR